MKLQLVLVLLVRYVVIADGSYTLSSSTTCKWTHQLDKKSGMLAFVAHLGVVDGALPIECTSTA